MATSPRIVVERRSDRVGFTIGPSGGAEHAVFAVFFLVMLALVTSGPFVRGVSTSAADAAASGSASPVGFLVAVAIGLGLLVPIFGFAWMLFGHEELVADASGLMLVSALGPVRRRRRFPLADVSNVRWISRRVQAKRGASCRPVLVCDVLGKTRELTGALSFLEANFLERELNLGLEDLRRQRLGPTPFR